MSYAGASLPRFLHAALAAATSVATAEPAAAVAAAAEPAAASIGVAVAAAELATAIALAAAALGPTSRQGGNGGVAFSIAPARYELRAADRYPLFDFYSITACNSNATARLPINIAQRGLQWRRDRARARAAHAPAVLARCSLAFTRALSAPRWQVCLGLPAPARIAHAHDGETNAMVERDGQWTAVATPSTP